MIGKQIRDLRVQKGLTQKDLSVGICGKSMLSQIEANKANPSIEVLKKLCTRLGVSVIEIGHSSYVLKNDDIEAILVHLNDLYIYKEYKTVINKIKRLLSNKKLMDFPLTHFNCLEMFARCNMAFGNYEDALKSYKSAYDVASLHRLLQQQVIASNGAACSYYQMGKLQESQEQWMRAYELRNAVEVDPRLKIKIIYNLTKQFYKNALYSKAHSFAEEGIFLCRKTGIYECGGHLESMAGLIHLHEKNYRSSLDRFFKALNFYEFLGDLQSVTGTYLNIAKTYCFLKEPVEAQRYLNQIKSAVLNDFTYLLPEFNEISNAI